MCKELSLFDDVPQQKNGEQKYCRTCLYRARYALNEFSPKVVQCCELLPSKRSNSGFKTIKVTDKACGYYKDRDSCGEQKG